NGVGGCVRGCIWLVAGNTETPVQRMTVRQSFRNGPAIIDARFKRGAFVVVIPGNQLEVGNCAGQSRGISESVKPGCAALLQNNPRWIMLKCAIGVVQAFIASTPHLLRGEMRVGSSVEACPAAIVGIEIILDGICPQIGARRLRMGKCWNAALVIAKDHVRAAIACMVDRVSPDL